MPRSKTGKALTKVRGPVHGNFAEGATFTQGVMNLLGATSGWPRLSAARKESIHMIVHKVHRIVTGTPDHPDHWDDIGGYAELGKNDGLKPVRQKIAKVRMDRPKKVRKPKPTPVRLRPAKPAKKNARKKVPVKKAVVQRPPRAPRRPAVAAPSPVREAA